MTRRRVLAAALLSVVMILVVALIVYTERTTASANITVWRLTRDVVAGQPYSAAVVEKVQVRAGPGDFNYEAAGPNALAARFAVSLTAHDIVRPDDLVPDSTVAEVAFTVQDPPPLNPGDRVDVYAALAAGQQALIGRGVTVETVTGGALTVLVPATDEASWVAIAASNVSLHVARIEGRVSSASDPMDPQSAIRILCGPACADASLAGSPSP